MYQNDPGEQARLLQEREEQRWQDARARVLTYLRAAGFSDGHAAVTADTVMETVAARLPTGDTEEIIEAALTEVSDLCSIPVDQPLAPQSTPVSIRRQSLSPSLRWRRGGFIPRPVLIPAPGKRNSARGRASMPDTVHLDSTAKRRRAGFTLLIVLTAVWSVWSLAEILGVNGLSALDLLHLGVFSILVVWLGQSFWTHFAGFVVLMERLVRGHSAFTAPAAADPNKRIAMIMPIYNEDTGRVFAGLEAMWRDVVRADPTGAARIDFFILADTTDPDVWLAEVEAWRRLRAGNVGGERIYYRRRIRNTGRKTGNIEDFLTRWGGAYDSMVVLDADSLMTGPAIHELIRRMDANPAVGLIQAPPKLVRGQTVFARVLQSAGELYGPLSAAGLGYWARGEGNYWGHNAIIRVRPFIELCGLPNLPGRAPFGGQILSHDFVEAALIRRGGWQVWIADDLPGSYEEPPPSIEDFAVRDRRWCQGNLQHARLLMTRHLHWVSRLHFGIGIMSYLTSPLWLLFLVLSAMQAWQRLHSEPIYFADGWPFPILPVSVQAEATVLLAVTLGLLFLPKVLGVLVALVDGVRARALGGRLRIIATSLLETLYSALLAPIMMVLHTWFVFTILSGVSVEWKPQRREAERASLGEAARTFAAPILVGVGATIAAWAFIPELFFWLLPVLAGLVLAAPIAMLGASEAAGDWLGQRHLLITSEETLEPTVLAEVDLLEARNRQDVAPEDRLIRVIMEPQSNVLHLQLLDLVAPSGGSQDPPLSDSEREELRRRAVYLGPAMLTSAERRRLLESRELVERLHKDAWMHWPVLMPAAVERFHALIGIERSTAEESPRAIGLNEVA